MVKHCSTDLSNFFGKTTLIMCKINFYKSFADTAAFALCALADSIVYPSITFTFQFILITCLVDIVLIP